MTHYGNINELFSGFLSGTLKPQELTSLFQYFGETDEPELRNLIRSEMDRIESIEELEDSEDQLEAVFVKIGKRIEGRVQAKPGGQTINLRLVFRYAASILLVIGLGWLLNHAFHPFHKNREWKTVATGFERKKLVLNDGTKIWLGPQTTFEYPETFNDGARVVRLSGEAFFDVTRDAEHPFKIQSGILTTQVLGTSFHVDAYRGETLAKVTVLTGRVSVAAGGTAEKVTLVPYEQAIFQSREKKLFRQAYPRADEMIYRREGNINYEGTSLTDVIRDVQRMSDLNISAGSDLSECVFYGEMNAGDDPIAFLESVCRVNNLLLNKQDQTHIIITGEGCRKSR